MAGLGYSGMRDWEQRVGSIQDLMREVQSARYKEVGSRPDLLALTPNERAELDRYTTFAQLAKDNPAQIPGGMLAMSLTEMLKAAQPLQSAASNAWRTVTGQPRAADFFGGADVSKPSLENLMAALYGAHRGLAGSPEGVTRIAGVRR